MSARARPRPQRGRARSLALSLLRARAGDYQGEIDALTRRSRFSDAAFFGLYKALYDNDVVSEGVIIAGHATPPPPGLECPELVNKPELDPAHAQEQQSCSAWNT